MRERMTIDVPFLVMADRCPSCDNAFTVFSDRDEVVASFLPDHCPFCGKPMVPDDTPPLTTYHQLDPRWKDVKLGFGGVEDTTIGRYGCVLCCATMASERATHEALTPPQANELVKDAGGFTGPNGNLFRWVAGGEALSLEYRWSKSWVTTPANLGTIIAEVDAGNFVLIQVDYDPSDADVDEHWVLIREHIGDGKFLIDDPMTGDVHTFPPAYCKRGWSAARGIFKAVVFTWDGDA